MKIGEFIQDQNGQMHGKIFGLGFGVTSVLFEPQLSREQREYFRLVADPAKQSYEVGRAWIKQTDNGVPYHSVSIDSPALPKAITAALFADRENDNVFNLIWNRMDAPAPKVDLTASTKAKSFGRTAANDFKAAP